MLKDFRPNLKPSEPKPETSKEEIEQLFRKGHFNEAQGLCRRSGTQISEFQTAIEVGSRKLYLSRRTGELLSFMYNTGIRVQYDIVFLLKAVFDLGDYHGFLKQAYRFKTYAGIEKEIDSAIEALLGKQQVADAEGWRRKFNALQQNV